MTVADPSPPGRHGVREADLAGFKFFAPVMGLLARLHGAGTRRDAAGNRTLHFDQHVALLLLYFFNPVVSSLRAVTAASALGKVQRKLGCVRASLGSLSEANRVFDADLLLPVVAGLSARCRPVAHDARLDDVAGVIELVDGTFLTALPALVEAVCLGTGTGTGTGKAPRAFKLHAHFDLLKGVPASMALTEAGASEWRQLAASLRPGRTYVMDRGYACFELFGLVRAAGSSFVCRVRDNSVYRVLEERPVTPAAAAAGVVSDRVVMLGGDTSAHRPAEPLRLVGLAAKPHPKRAGGKGRGGPGQSDVILVATDLMGPPAEVVGLLLRCRWEVEIFFRFFKHVLGCRHLLAHNPNGTKIQTYTAIICCLLIALYTGGKPTLRTYEMLCHHLSGLATADELAAHVAGLQNQPG